MGNDERQYLVISQPAEDDGGRFLLVVSKSSNSLFGSSGGQIVYSVDEVEVKNGVVYGIKDGALVAQFPSRMDYLLVRRDRASFLTPDEAAEKQSKIDKALRDAMKKYEGLEGPETTEGLEGQTRGFQYL